MDFIILQESTVKVTRSFVLYISKYCVVLINELRIEYRKRLGLSLMQVCFPYM